MDLKKIQAKIAARLKAMKELLSLCESEDRTMTEEEQKIYDAHEAEVKELRIHEERLKKLREEEERSRTVPDANRVAAEKAAEEERPKRQLYPAQFIRTGQLRAYKGDKAEERAYRAGQWIRATLFGDQNAALWCRDAGLQMLATSSGQAGGVNSSGGYLVPEELSSAIIDLREQYGVFRRECRVMPMASDTMIVPRRTGGLTAYFVAENNDTTASTKTWDAVQLSAKELAALVRYPTSLAEDAIINLADDLANEIAYAFSLLEDQCGFIGDGTSTYGGITGVAVKIDDGTHTASVADAASGNVSFETLDLTDFHAAVGKLPLYARNNAKWFISAAGFANSMERLMYAGGGNTTSNISGGIGLSFLGYPVVLSQVLNSTLGSDVSAIKCLFGDLRLAATMGSRRDIMIEASRERYFEFRQVAIQGTQRFDINVHDLGSTSTAGPIIAVKTAAS